MSGSLRDALIAFLGDPKTFMASNVILPPSSPSNQLIKGTGSGIFQFSFEKSSVTAAFGTATCPIYRIANPDNYNTDKPRFMAYYCHYSSDNTFDLMLGDKMDLMLTPRMDGCSFGVGSETDTGARLVVHSNVSRTASTSEGIVKQGSDQAGKIKEIIPAPTKIFGPEDYLDDNIKGTTAGVRKNGRWTFFMQRWKFISPSTYIWEGITDIA
jgi:hypothetical protein